MEKEKREPKFKPRIGKVKIEYKDEIERIQKENLYNSFI